MSKVYIGNAFSLQMVNLKKYSVKIEEVDVENLKKTGLLSDCTSAIGHEDTANVVSNDLDMDVPANRINISLNQGDTLIVAQLVGGRLPEGTKELPNGFSIKYMIVKLGV